jgi:hypothetical protein
LISSPSAISTVAASAWSGVGEACEIERTGPAGVRDRPRPRVAE